MLTPTSVSSGTLVRFCLIWVSNVPWDPMDNSTKVTNAHSSSSTASALMRPVGAPDQRQMTWVTADPYELRVTPSPLHLQPATVMTSVFLHLQSAAPAEAWLSGT